LANPLCQQVEGISLKPEKTKEYNICSLPLHGYMLEVNWNLLARSIVIPVLDAVQLILEGFLIIKTANTKHQR
jgi:hypothetical protein